MRSVPVPIQIWMCNNRCMLAIRCLHCGAYLQQHRTRRAMYCKAVCRAAHARRKRGEFARLPPSIDTLFHLLREHAPPPASGYQLLLDDGAHLYRYPPSDRSWLAADGLVSYRTAYRLYPFEIPIVPRSALYAVQLVTRFYRLPTPDVLTQGVRLNPVRAGYADEGERIA